MEYNSETMLILESLSKDKRELLHKINEIDKVIKRIKYGSINLGGTKRNNDKPDIEQTEQPQPFPLKADLKIQVLKVLDLIGVACKLSEIRDKYHEITGHNVNFRETLRNLNKHDILKLLQPKNSIRGLYWIKAEWLEDNGTRLKEQHKFNGFDLLFTDEMIEFK
jgi:hypothetical protein